ncbi:DUF1540 domain-containing protein [Paenibacillus cisolokensis]|jgi:hypothetical protein|uniref:DUF1540 domain-containing protein n=1 Tax=Paenibacillus cisolokensis TaxID=1658519 RepID=A0ABQ4N2H3_9BACL|nr:MULTISPECIES: DUF1540 domain-containing protein [Paenibacillus]ALS27319.1 hypothetical protein IJ21_19180 [Paenibacillus sp. 32O-W]GIQ62328.1 hypothetical protein PACILC2_08960 [Paenibacillus cisolokensis]
MPKGVLCTVANCTFWGEGNKCNADSILIDLDKHASENYDSEFAKELHQEIAEESSATCCHTFRPKR